MKKIIAKRAITSLYIESLLSSLLIILLYNLKNLLLFALGFVQKSR